MKVVREELVDTMDRLAYQYESQAETDRQIRHVELTPTEALTLLTYDSTPFCRLRLTTDLRSWKGLPVKVIS